MQVIEVPVILGFVPGTAVVVRQHAENPVNQNRKFLKNRQASVNPNSRAQILDTRGRAEAQS